MVSRRAGKFGMEKNSGSCENLGDVFYSLISSLHAAKEKQKLGKTGDNVGN